ncbi:MAG: DUF2007 domain-containing protein [Pirellulaceae bacterium]|nr:DUF2007 domain-containing protein [Pirellulaceae bacterium]
MSAKLATVGTFSTSTEASIVRNHLEADGIRVFLADEAIVGMAWHLGTAVGGVKLQVAEGDVERALAVIESHGAASIAEEEWQSDHAEDDPQEEPDDAEEHEIGSPIDDMVERALRAAGFGLLLLPLQLYSLWLLTRIALHPDPLSHTNRRRAVATLILDLPIIVLSLAWLWIAISGWVSR